MWFAKWHRKLRLLLSFGAWCFYLLKVIRPKYMVIRCWILICTDQSRVGRFLHNDIKCNKFNNDCSLEHRSNLWWVYMWIVNNDYSYIWNSITCEIIMLVIMTCGYCYCAKSLMYISSIITYNRVVCLSIINEYYHISAYIFTYIVTCVWYMSIDGICGERCMFWASFCFIWIK